MQTTSALWKSYQALPAKQYEYKVVIGTDEYYLADIFGMSSELQLCDDSVFTLGNVFSRKLNLSVKPKGTIGKMANVDVFIRMNGDSGPTEWLPQGKFFIDTRQKSGLATVFECYDKVLMMESSFIIEGETLTYPMSMSDAVNTICTRLSLTFTNPSAIHAGFNIEYPNDLTMREVLGYIADANGGNFILNDSGELQLVVPANGTSVASPSYGKLYDDNDQQTFDKVIMYYNDTDGFESGTGTDEFVDNNLWATQAIADYVLSVLTGYTHKPYMANRVYVDPAIELGDTLTLGTVDYVLFNATVTYGAGNVVMEISAPGETELNHEYPYVGSYQKAIKNKVTLGATYYGTSISRDNGIRMEKSDGSAGMTINTDVWEVVVNAIQKLWIDFDQDELFFDGKLSAQAIEAIKADIDVVVSDTIITNALYASSGRFANLSVNRLDTLQYLTGASALYGQDLREQIHDFIEATRRDDLAQVQYTNNDGDSLYWTDDTETEMTTEETVYPVMVYQYDKDVKLSIKFFQDVATGYNIPKIALGEGDGVTENSGKGFIYKDVDGLRLTYNAQNTGLLREMKLSDKGIFFNPDIMGVVKDVSDAAITINATPTVKAITMEMGQDAHLYFDLTINANCALDTTLTIAISLDDVNQFTVNEFLKAGGDSFTLSLPFFTVPIGMRTVTVSITSDNEFTISAGNYLNWIRSAGVVGGITSKYPSATVYDTAVYRDFSQSDQGTVKVDLGITPVIVADATNSSACTFTVTDEATVTLT